MVDVLETLIVDDDKITLDITSCFLKHFKLPFRVFSNPLDVLRYTIEMKNQGISLGMGFFDFSMPKMNGYELAVILKEVDPEIPLVLVSSDNNLNYNTLLRIFSNVEDKPFSFFDLQKNLFRYHRNADILERYFC